MLLSIRYSLISAPTSHLLTYIGEGVVLGNPKSKPTDNYNDVLDAWELLFKSKKIKGDNVASAILYKGGKWNGKHVLTEAGNTMEELMKWDTSKPINTPQKEVLGEFYNDAAMAQTTVPTVEDDLADKIANDHAEIAKEEKAKKPKKKKEVAV